MVHTKLRDSVGWGSVLLVATFFTTFIVAIFPREWQMLMYKGLFTVIYFSAVLTMEKHRKRVLLFSLVAFVLNWLSEINKQPVFPYVSRLINIVFFCYIVITLVAQVAKSKTVTMTVILESINGYLLIGIMFSSFVNLIGQWDSDSYNFISQAHQASLVSPAFSDNIYYTFITMTTVGYGDMLPLTPISRSLATMIAITGQLYLGIIIAMLVGKFASQRNQ